MANPYVTPKTFAFLQDLAAHNDREWFQANKARYEQDVKGPALKLVADFSPHLNKISKCMLADPRPVGGSLFRIHRDTRFAKDKTPYKTHLGITFRHAEGRDVHGPIFYLHVEPAQVFAAAGMWHPPSESLARIRQAIVDHPAKWKRVLAKVELGENEGGLKRPPRGFDPEHPYVEDLKRKSFTSGWSYTKGQVTDARFLAQLARDYKARAPLVKFLADAVGLPF